MEELSSKNKKNTDCVYFLASPLTCKKGMQCEFRHSEIARLNPRDCWYWLSGNCLNPDCAFRHPPLDAADEETPNVETTPAKGKVPCYFYAQGYCSKGDKCGFMHGYSGYSFQAQPQPAAPSAQNLPKAKTAQPSLDKVAVNPSRETVTKATTCHASEEEKRVANQLCSSPDDYELQEQDGGVGRVDDMVDHRDMDWPTTRGSSADIDELGASEELYDDESYDEDETVLDPGNGQPQVGRLENLHRAVEPGYDYGGWHLENNRTSGGLRSSYSDPRCLDPPYHPSAPYDRMLDSRQGLMKDHGIEADIESLFGMNRRRLEDRLIFPRNNGVSNFTTGNRFRLFHTNGDMNNVHNRHDVQPALCSAGHGLRPRSAQLNVRRLGNGGILSRLGAPRPSIKSRLRFTNNRQLQQQQQQQQQRQHQYSYHHHHHRSYPKNARYLGIVQQQQQWRQGNKASKRTNNKHNPDVSNNNTNANVKVDFPAHFDGPKSLAELKAAKLVDSAS